MKYAHYKKSFGEKLWIASIYVLMIVLAFTFIYPVIYCVAMSLSDDTILRGNPIGFLPQGFSLKAYEYLLGSPLVYRRYANTILYALLSTVFTLLFTSMIAYAQSVKEFSGRKVITVYLTITMFIGGGMIPSYINMKNLGLMDTIWALVVPGCVGAYSVIIYKTFFRGLPASLMEAAKIDGAGHMRILFTIVMPLSKPLLACMALFCVVGQWNGWFSALIYMNDTDWYPIQMLLRSMMVQAKNIDPETMGLQTALANNEWQTQRTLRGALVIITMAPILCVYPFAQKYFAQGILVGSIKE